MPMFPIDLGFRCQWTGEWAHEPFIKFVGLGFFQCEYTISKKAFQFKANHSLAHIYMGYIHYMYLNIYSVNKFTQFHVVVEGPPSEQIFTGACGNGGWGGARSVHVVGVWSSHVAGD